MKQFSLRSGKCVLLSCAILFAVQAAQGGEGCPALQHLPRTPEGWSVAQSAHFRILHNQPREFAEQAARTAERTRTTVLEKWFGTATADELTIGCDIFLHASGSDYNRATGVPAQVPGHSTVNRDGARIISVRVDVHCDVANFLTGVLPHEVTHAVVATQFGQQRVPSWANEAMAVLTESRPLIDRHLRNLPRHRQEGQLFRVADLLAMRDYPAPSGLGPFYAQSTSLVEFLTNAKDSATFSAFLREGLRSDWQTASKKHYGWSMDELERRWRIHAFPDVASR